MGNILKISKIINPFKKKITIEGDKSISIRWALLASQATGKSKSYNLLKSDDVINTLNCLKKLGIKIKLYQDTCEIFGAGLNGNFVIFDISLIIFLSKFFFELIPVPTAVPP